MSSSLFFAPQTIVRRSPMTDHSLKRRYSPEHCPVATMGRAHHVVQKPGPPQCASNRSQRTPKAVEPGTIRARLGRTGEPASSPVDPKTDSRPGNGDRQSNDGRRKCRPRRGTASTTQSPSRTCVPRRYADNSSTSMVYLEFGRLRVPLTVRVARALPEYGNEM